MLWSLWRASESEQLQRSFQRSALAVEAASGGARDPLVFSLLLAAEAWRGRSVHELALETALASFLPGALPLVVSVRVRPTLCAELPEQHFYRRLARLVDATDGTAGRAEELLRRIEDFGHVSSWLKVAGDDKAEVLADALARLPPQLGECILELGCFVGYTAARFALQLTGQRPPSAGLSGVSLEIDPVHVAVSRYHLDLARLSPVAEVWVGQLQDTMAKAPESLGSHGIGLVFMDQRGTTFHEDLAQLECLHAPAALSHITADNTVKPGSPIFLWHLCSGILQHRFLTQLWSMPEFALADIEDWQAVALLRAAS